MAGVLVVGREAVPPNPAATLSARPRSRTQPAPKGFLTERLAEQLKPAAVVSVCLEHTLPICWLSNAAHAGARTALIMPGGLSDRTRGRNDCSARYA